jgi:hypothetical protein
MAQDVTLAEESAVDEEFATYLTRSNSVRKSLATAMAQAPGVPRPPGGVPRCENLKLGWRIESWVLFFRGFTILGFSFKNGAKIRDKVNSCTIASVITFK